MSTPGSRPESTPPTPAAGGAIPAPATAGLRQLMLIKRGQHYLFRYAAGDEMPLLIHLAEMARDAGSGLDWFDAAMLAEQMGDGAGRAFERLSRPSQPRKPQGGT